MIETLLQMLQQIPGSTFLWYFAGFSVICILLARLWARADGSTQYPLPEPTRFDPIAIAALRGGTNSVIRTIIFSLWDRNLIKIRGNGKDAKITTLKHCKDTKLDLVEKEIYHALQVTTKPGDLFHDTSLLLKIETYLRPIYEKLENQHIARTEKDRSRIWWIFGSFMLVIVSVGGTKLYLGLTYGRPVLFLIILLIISVIVLYAALSPKATPTTLGWQYLQSLEEHFGWLRESIKQTRTPEGIDPAFALAVFGIGVLGPSDLYKPFNKAFPSNKAGSGGCSGGCGGGYSGGGCSGGGGCGGGSDGGGGGCGGCGGGG